MTKLRKALARFWILPFIAGCVLAVNWLYPKIGPPMPTGQVVIDAPVKLQAPFSDREVCGYHVCVQHGGSTCTSRTWPDVVTARTPDGQVGRLGMTHSLALTLAEGGSAVSEGSPLPLQTGNERIENACAQKRCTWQEHLVLCGESHQVRWEIDGDDVQVWPPQDTMEELVTRAMSMYGAILLLVIALITNVVFRIRAPKPKPQA